MTYNPIFEGVQDHIDAISAGIDTVERRLQLIRGSNYLNDDAKLKQSYFVKSFCLAAALEPLAGTVIELGDDLLLQLGPSRKALQGNELPGVRTDYNGDLVVEGEFFRKGKRCARFDERGFPLWPLIITDAPCTGSGPWENFRPQALELLRHAGEIWPVEA